MQSLSIQILPTSPSHNVPSQDRAQVKSQNKKQKTPPKAIEKQNPINHHLIRPSDTLPP